MATILVLDDVADSGTLIKRILERKGHEVHPFTLEEEALEFAATHRPDLAILDLKLRRMSGVEVLVELKRVSPGTRALMLTGYPTLETASQAMTRGAVDYLVKPIDKDELELKVAEALKV